MHAITLIPGDGSGPEIAAATCRIIEASGVAVEWDTTFAVEQLGDITLVKST